jgi:hypothetical protein
MQGKTPAHDDIFWVLLQAFMSIEMLNVREATESTAYN